MRSNLVTRISWSLVMLMLTAATAAAHHGWAGQSTEAFELSGTVQKALSLSGPHATMQIKDKGGQVWDLTLAPPARTESAGLKENVIPLGATVTIHGKRNLDPKRFEVKTERVVYAGKTYNVYPDRP